MWDVKKGVNTLIDMLSRFIFTMWDVVKSQGKIDPLSWMSHFNTYEKRKYSRVKKEFLVGRIFALFEFNSSQKIVHNCTCVQ